MNCFIVFKRLSVLALAFPLVCPIISARASAGSLTQETPAVPGGPSASRSEALVIPPSKIFNMTHPERIPNEYIVVFKEPDELAKDVPLSRARSLEIAQGELPTTRESVTSIGLAMAERYRSVDLIPDGHSGNRRRIEHVYSNVFHGFSVTGVSPQNIVALARDPRVAYVDASVRAHQTAILETVQTTGGIICLGDSPEPVDTPCANPGGRAQYCTGSACAPWNLDRIDQTSGLDGAYHTYATGYGVTVFNLDTGMLVTHNEFKSPRQFIEDVIFDCDAIDKLTCVVKQIYSAITSSNPDMCGHGTATASMVGGEISGVAKEANIVSIDVTYDHLCGFSTAFIIAGLDWVYANRATGPNVVHMPLEVPVDDKLLPTFETAVTALVNTGTPVVVSAGNETLSACTTSPSRLLAVIAVGATTREDAIAGYSNYGPCVTLFAPGDHVTGADVAGYKPGETGGDDGNCSVVPQYGNNTVLCTFSGTSFASPAVAGIAALYLQSYPTASPAAVKAAILASATPGVLLDTRFNSGSPNLLASVWVPGNNDGTTTSPGGGAPPGTPNTKAKAFLPIDDFLLVH